MNESSDKYVYPNYMDELEVKYPDIKKLMGKQKAYGNLISAMSVNQNELNSLNQQIVSSTSSQEKHTLELKRDEVKEKIAEKEKRLDKMIGDMHNLVDDDKFKDIYNNYLESSNNTVHEIYKKSDELEANKTSFNNMAREYEKQIKDHEDRKLRLDSTTLFYQIWMFMAIITIIVIYFRNKVSLRTIVALTSVYVIYVVFRYYSVVLSWFRNFM